MLWSSSAPSQFKGLRRLGTWQVQSVMLLNYLGSELKQWPQYLYSLQSSLSSTLWPGLCTFFSNISFFKKWEGKSSKFNFQVQANYPQSHLKTNCVVVMVFAQKCPDYHSFFPNSFEIVLLISTSTEVVGFFFNYFAFSHRSNRSLVKKRKKNKDT